MRRRQLVAIATAALLAAHAASAEGPSSLDDLISITVAGEPLHKVLQRLHADYGYTYAYPPGDLVDRPGPHMYIEPVPAPVAFQQLAAAYGLCATVLPNAKDTQRTLVIISTCEAAEERRKYLEAGGEPPSHPMHMWLGVYVRDGHAQGNSGTGTRGVLVDEVAGEGTVAETAGIRVGDVITAYNGISIESRQQIAELVSKTQPGDEVTVIVVRDGRPITLVARF